MTERGDGDFHDQDIPSQAELDAEDMAELAKRSSHDRDRAGLYPVRNTNPGPVPVPLPNTPSPASGRRRRPGRSA